VILDGPLVMFCLGNRPSPPFRLAVLYRLFYGYLLSILLLSPRSDSTCTLYEMSGDGFGRRDGLHNYLIICIEFFVKKTR